ncbi:pyruvate dehydrogenase (E1 beta subunit) [Kyrpidia spormannii]|uniref:Pyruvate dehydrogenase (E1 beta subunit) n=1 Tax=Kyrpidia spormannii TaxID=2055160 RepID=A0ACA8Z990_9BACL|nr:pyruvate dehydrogenase (E1 beta subunit) [Kyrpidia spormannii]
MRENRNMTIIQAIQDGLYTALAEDDRVLVFGEDVGQNGGVFRATDGLQDAFGPRRVFDTPLSESGIVGTAVGMAAAGLKPVVEIQFMGFIYPAFEQIVSHAARVRTRTRGRHPASLVIRAPYGGGIRAPELHSDSSEAFFVHQPGLKVVAPSGPYDAKGLLLAAIDDPDPVVFLEPIRLYRAFKEEVPLGHYTVPIGKAKVVREGGDLAMFVWGGMVPWAMEAAEKAARQDGIETRVVDLRTLFPLDVATIVESVEHTGRAIIVHEAPRTAGVGAEVATLIQERAFYSLEAPVVRVAGFDVPFPLFSLEDFYLPGVARILSGIRRAVAA